MLDEFMQIFRFSRKIIYQLIITAIFYWVTVEPEFFIWFAGQAGFAGALSARIFLGVLAVLWYTLAAAILLNAEARDRPMFLYGIAFFICANNSLLYATNAWNKSFVCSPVVLLMVKKLFTVIAVMLAICLLMPLGRSFLGDRLRQYFGIS